MNWNASSLKNLICSAVSTRLRICARLAACTTAILCTCTNSRGALALASSPPPSRQEVGSTQGLRGPEVVGRNQMTRFPNVEAEARAKARAGRRRKALATKRRESQVQLRTILKEATRSTGPSLKKWRRTASWTKIAGNLVISQPLCSTPRLWRIRMCLPLSLASLKALTVETSATYRRRRLFSVD